MSNFYFLAFKSLWVRKLRTLFTLSGIALGVALVLAVSITNKSAERSFEAFFANASGRANLTITSADNMTTNRGFRASVLSQVKNVQGVATAAALTSNSALVTGSDKRPTSIVVTGIDPATDTAIRTYELVEGRFLQDKDRSHEIVLPRKLADKRGWQAGTKIEVLVRESPVDFTVVGLLADKGAARTNNGSVGFIHLEVAREVFERGAKIDQIDLAAEPDIAASPEQLRQLKAGLASALGDDYTVDFPSAIGSSIAESLSGLTTALSMFTVIALIVSSLLTYNTFSMVVVERTHEWGLLRSLGAGRGQILRLVLTEAIFLAALGVGLGLAGGLLLSIPLIRIMEVMFGGITVDEFTVPTAGLISSVISGSAATLVASAIPAWNAARITPMEALRARGQTREGFMARHGPKIGTVMLAAVIINHFVPFLSSEAFLILAFVGITLLVPQAIVVLERLIRGLMSALYGMPGRLGSMSIRRNKARAALTVGVIVVGAAMTVAMGGMEVSFKAELDGWLESVIGGDLWISRASYSSIRPELGQRIAQAPGISGITPERWDYVTVAGATNDQGYVEKRKIIMVRVIEPASRQEVAPLRLSEDQAEAGRILADFAAGDAVLLTSNIQAVYKVKRGDSVRVRTARGERDFRVAGIVNDVLQGGQTMMASWNDMYKYFGKNDVTFFVARLAPGVDAAAAERDVQSWMGEGARLEIQTAQEFRAEMDKMIAQTWILFDAIVVIAIIVGALGVVNTMTMSILERSREIGMLRSVGMTRWQVTWMVLAEAGTMGVIAALFGIGAGLALSVVMVNGLSQGSGWIVRYVFPTVPLYTGVVVALVVSQAAALYPTWRAGRAVIVDAIKSE